LTNTNTLFVKFPFLQSKIILVPLHKLYMSHIHEGLDHRKHVT
jgi:hypothetical protein